MIPSYFPMDSIKRCLVCVVFLISCLTFAVLCAAMFTQEWTVVKPVRTGLNVSVRMSGSFEQTGTRFQGLIYFGLFRGKKILNYGFGNRQFDMRIVCVAKLKVCMFSTKDNATERVKELQENLYSISNKKEKKMKINDSLLSFGLWATTVSTNSLAAMFAMIGGAFAISNIARTSTEIATGFISLYLWNILGGLCSIITVSTWAAHYFLKFRKNVMTQEEIQQLWTSEYRSCMGYSFYLVLLTILLFLLNLGMLTLIIKQPWVDRKLKADLRKKLSNPSFLPKSPAPSLTKKRQK